MFGRSRSRSNAGGGRRSGDRGRLPWLPPGKAQSSKRRDTPVLFGSTAGSGASSAATSSTSSASSSAHTPVTPLSMLEVTQREFLDFLNTQPLERLLAVNKIGPVRAKQIIDYRTVNPKPFQTLKDVEEATNLTQRQVKKIVMSYGEMVLDSLPSV